MPPKKGARYLDKSNKTWYVVKKEQEKTDDVEIKTANAPTESPGCWNPGGEQAVKWTTEGAVKGTAEYSATYWHTSVAGDMQVSCSSAQHRLRIKVAPRCEVVHFRP